jgi:chromosomal replication initiator protein
MTIVHAHSDDDPYQGAWSTAVSLLEAELDSQIYSAYFSGLSFSHFDPITQGFLVDTSSKFLCSHLDRSYASRINTLLREVTNLSEVHVVFRVRSLTPEAALLERTQPPRYVVVRKPIEIAPNQLEVDLSVPSHSVASPSREAVSPSREELRPLSSPSQEIGLQLDSSPFLSNSSSPIIPQPHASPLSVSPLNARYTFDTFVVGNSNQFCHAAAMRVAEKPGASYNPLFIYGGVGLGKTHLLHSIGNEVLRVRPSAKVLYLSSEAFTNELILALRNAKMEEFKRRFRAIEVLLIDDIQFICGKERTQEEFFHTFNALYNARHQIVITSDKIPSDIPGIEERLQTRFSWGLTADLQAPDFETRVAILKRKASLEGFFLEEAIAHLIAERVSSNVRELEGALTRLHALCSIKNIPITLESAAAAIQPLLHNRTVNISVDDIKKAVATHFSIKVSDMVSKRRTKILSFPRHVAMYLCRKHTTCSYPEIGQQFGGRDHSSVIHAAHVVSSKIPADVKIKHLVEDIERKLLSDI